MKLEAWKMFSALAVLLLALSGCRMSYSAKPITARVVDSQTKEPLEGVVVVAHWELQGGPEGYRQGDLTVLEAVTDHSGTFHFPAWGPKKVPTGRPINARLQELDPELLFFKSGYRFFAAKNWNHTDVQQAASVRFSDYDAQTIEMPKFDGTLSEYARELAKSEGLLLDPLLTHCGWRNLPLMLNALAACRTEAFGWSGKTERIQTVHVGTSSNC